MLNQAVNSEVKEIVFNKESTSHYPGCYADAKRSTCNAMTEIIPIEYSEVCTRKLTFYENSMKTIWSIARRSYIIIFGCSQGFCCSCKMAVNIQRQMRDCQGQTRFRHVVHGRNALLNEDIETLISRMVDNIDSDDEVISNDTLRSSGTHKKQIRGGQSCESTNTPAENVDEEYRFHESSHCLKFSDLWLDQYNIIMLMCLTVYHLLCPAGTT